MYIVLSDTSYIILVVFTMLDLISFIGSKVNNEETTVFGYKPIYIMSGSMDSSNPQKTIKANSLIISKKLKNKSELNVGDVVIYQLEENVMRGGQNITHRIIELNIQLHILEQ